LKRFIPELQSTGKTYQRAALRRVGPIVSGQGLPVRSYPLVKSLSGGRLTRPPSENRVLHVEDCLFLEGRALRDRGGATAYAMLHRAVRGVAELRSPGGDDSMVLRV
jgi:hypothetical protein